MEAQYSAHPPENLRSKKWLRMECGSRTCSIKSHGHTLYSHNTREEKKGKRTKEFAVEL
jgi:hypothetical protein